MIVFDSNETLLDLAPLDAHFGRIFGDPSLRALWFRQLVELFLAASVIGEYRPFDQLARSALDILAEQQRLTVSTSDRDGLQEAMLHLPPHPDVRPALARLKKGGLPLAVLTNSTLPAATAQMRHTELAPYFDAVLSADTVRRYKPSREAYVHAATSLGVRLSDIRLVAAHGWDISGALAAGCRAAFVARPGKSMDPHAPQPDIRGPDLTSVATSILSPLDP